MPPSNSQRTILVIDDDEALVRIMVVDSLEVTGFSVLEAADAEEALVVLAAHPEIGLLFTCQHARRYRRLWFGCPSYEGATGFASCDVVGPQILFR